MPGRVAPGHLPSKRAKSASRDRAVTDSLAPAGPPQRAGARAAAPATPAPNPFLPSPARQDGAQPAGAMERDGAQRVQRPARHGAAAAPWWACVGPRSAAAGPSKRWPGARDSLLKQFLATQVVKLSGILQAFSGPARAPQASRRLACPAPTRATAARWLLLARAVRPLSQPCCPGLQGTLGGRPDPYACTPCGPVPLQARRLLNIDRVEKWFGRAFSESLKPAAVAVTVNSPGAPGNRTKRRRASGRLLAVGEELQPAGYAHMCHPLRSLPSLPPQAAQRPRRTSSIPSSAACPRRRWGGAWAGSPGGWALRPRTCLADAPKSCPTMFKRPWPQGNASKMCVCFALQGIPVFTFAEDVAASGGYWLM